MNTRLLEEKDLDAIMRLRNANSKWFFGGTVSPEGHRRWFANLDRAKVEFFVIEEDNQVIGTFSFTIRDEEIEIGNLLLDGDHQGKGIMQTAVQSKMLPGKKYYGTVMIDNEKSLAFFKRCGFEPQSVRLVYPTKD